MNDKESKLQSDRQQVIQKKLIKTLPIIAGILSILFTTLFQSMIEKVFENFIVYLFVLIIGCLIAGYFIGEITIKVTYKIDFIIKIIDLVKNPKVEEAKIAIHSRYKLLKLSGFFFSTKTQKEVFFPTMSDWDEEIFEALRKNKDAKLFMIHLRNTYTFILLMWQKSPIGDLIEFVRKIAS